MSFHMTIDGKRVEAHEGELVLQVARRAGIPIPSLCAHDAVEPFGACRLCMVEVTREAWGEWRDLVTACLYPAAPGLVVETHSERVIQSRRTVLELLLARTPESEVIRDLAADHGVVQTPFEPRVNADTCILCGLCVRVCERAATAAITTVNRGHHKEIGTPWGGPPPDCIGCLACAHVCPTGHIQYEETATTRTIWGRTFDLKRCATTGKPLPITEDQAAFLAENKGLAESYFAHSAEANRARTATAFGRMARWNKLGFTQEPEEVAP